MGKLALKMAALCLCGAILLCFLVARFLLSCFSVLCSLQFLLLTLYSNPLLGTTCVPSFDTETQTFVLADILGMDTPSCRWIMDCFHGNAGKRRN